MGDFCQKMVARLCLVLAAVLLVGLASAKVTAIDEKRAKVVTELEVNNEMMQQASKEYFKFSGEKPPKAPSDDDPTGIPDEPQSREVRKMMDTLSSAKHLYNVMKVGKKAAREMEKNGTSLVDSEGPKPIDNKMTGALLTEVVHDYAKATGKELIHKPGVAKKPTREILPPHNLHDVCGCHDCVLKHVSVGDAIDGVGG